MKKLFLLITIIFFTNCSSQNQNISKLKNNQATNKTVAKYLELINYENRIKQSFKLITPKLKKLFPKINEQFIDKFIKEVDYKYIKFDIINLYKANFTEYEMQKINQFYMSDIGKKLSKKQLLLSKESFKIGQKWGAIFVKKVISELMKNKRKSTNQSIKDCNNHIYNLKYEYCTPPQAITTSSYCKNKYGEGWEDSGGGSCRKLKYKKKFTNYYYYPKSKEDCFKRNMKPIKTANGSMICRK